MSSTLFKKPSAWWHLKQSLSLAGRMVISLIFLPCVAVYVIGAHSLETLMASSFSSAQRHKRPVVLITGASSGIGRAAALHLAKLGCEVFSGVRNQAAMDDLKKFDRLHPIILDVTKSEEIAAALNQVQQFLAEDDLIFTALVNNAGIGEVGAFETLDAARSDRVLQVNLHGMVSMTRTFLPLVRQSKGRIVNVGSGFGRLAAPGYVTYSASKFAIRGLSMGFD
uniref:Uncharacterized protein n=1 Tax=Spongospora subterranea TaxID=70186 RepID=A0A0H5R5U8_9EUKA|eukprot:CRZ03581.1 hypothetical protein [Spongospora subterranea]